MSTPFVFAMFRFFRLEINNFIIIFLSSDFSALPCSFLFILFPRRLKLFYSISYENSYVTISIFSPSCAPLLFEREFSPARDLHGICGCICILYRNLKCKRRKKGSQIASSSRFSHRTVEGEGFAKKFVDVNFWNINIFSLKCSASSFVLALLRYRRWLENR